MWKKAASLLWAVFGQVKKFHARVRWYPQVKLRGARFITIIFIIM